MILVLTLLFAAYVLCMLAIAYGFKKVRLFSSETINPKTRFSIVIPFRNEAENLPQLLRTIEAINYPPYLFEVLFVNDASEDSSEEIVAGAIQKSKLNFQLLQNKYFSNSPKKDAISEAIKHSKFEWIATTDADCELPQNWLKSLDSFIQQENPILVCGPVLYKSDGSFIQNFQQADGLSLQAVAVGSFGHGNPLLCNGANLAYLKSAFLKVGGFSGNDHIASGDDIFLMEKIKKAFPKQLQFLKAKDFIVTTKPQENWKSVRNQRIRWASKTSKQKNMASLILGTLVLLVNIAILLIPVLMLFSSENLGLYFLLVVAKIITDYLVIHQTASFFEVKLPFWIFIWQPFLYAALIVSVVFGSIKGNYIWKGRSFQKP